MPTPHELAIALLQVMTGCMIGAVIVAAVRWVRSHYRKHLANEARLDALLEELRRGLKGR